MSKSIFLKKISLKNFKGIRSLSIDFKDKETFIVGANATGKTTVFDSFTWLLFGKDSNGNSDTKFNIKTFDENGKPILKLEHEVSAILDVSGEIIELRRVYLEKWKKPRGSSQEVLENHYTEFYINGVKQDTKRDYDNFISSIIPEDVFKMITNPFYFNALHPVAQKEMLIDMSGGISDDDVAKLKPEFTELISHLTGKSLETFKKEIAAKKRAIKDELDELPARLDTVKSLMPEKYDWEDIEDEILSLKKEFSDIDSQIADKTKLIESEYNKKVEIRNKIGEKQIEKANLENELKLKLQTETSSSTKKISELKHQLSIINVEINSNNKELDIISERINNLDSELDVLRSAYREINNEKLVYSDESFICPTCKRPLEIDDIEAKQIEMQANFNENKAKLLKENQAIGKNKAAQKNELLRKKEQLKVSINNLKQKTSSLIGSISTLELEVEKENINKVDIDAEIKSNPEYIKIIKNISDLNRELELEGEPIDITDLKNKKTELLNSISILEKKLNNRDAINRAESLIKKYEKSRSDNNQALADLERLEFISLDFQKTKDDELTSRINNMFKMVKFSFIDEQLNGGEKITCKCLVNTNGSWVPFNTDANKAGTINAGIDIINAICKSKGVTAPIFIDNRESVNKLIPTDSQIINLYVTNHNKLSIRTSAEGEIEMYDEL